LNATQDHRRLTVTSPLGADALLVRSLQWNERLGQPFAGTVVLSSNQSDIDPKELLGQPLGLNLNAADEEGSLLHGFVASFAQLEPQGGFYEYRAELLPWFALLQHVGGSRIFQQQSVVEIFKAIAEQRGYSGLLDTRLSGVYRTRTYCVQYNESDFDFLTRLLEEEGIYYFFEYTADQHTLVLADDSSAHVAIPGYATLDYFQADNIAKPAGVFGWHRGQRFATASYVMRDYDFQKPRAEMTVRQNADTPSSWQWYQFPGRYFETDDGQAYARVRSEAAIANQSWASVDTNIHVARCGQTFGLGMHPQAAVNQDYLIAGTAIQASAGALQAGEASDARFACRLQLHPATIPFRVVPQAPRPIVRGPQIATVVGKAGEEIWTDAYGRIKVQFAWDLAGQNDDASSCWIRVTQPWTGKGFGAVSIPRIGEEVIVNFIDGDIDRPIVVGRVFNADRMPPEALADGQAKTVFRTRSTKEGEIDAFHELTFDDTADAESIYLHSERDFLRVVENNDALKVGFDKQDAGDQSIEIYNDQTVQVGVGSGAGSQTVEIAKDRSVTLDTGSDTLTVKQGDQSTEVTSGSITMEAGTAITLKCGGSSIEITPSGITIKSAQINLNGDAKVNLAAPEISAAADGQLQLSGMLAAVNADGELQLKGAIVQIN